VTIVDLRAQPIVPTPFGRWQPLNGALGVRSVGINAIVMEPGEHFDIEHDESESGHQEVYVVVAGRAAFRIGDEEVEAEPGMVVSAPDPAVVRSYRALEPETRVVCVGGPVPSEAYPFGEWIADAAQE
jgi:quercetin dioxygenase-like cupin family protein